MPPFRRAIVVFMASALFARAADRIPQPVLDKLKAATVFIKVKTPYTTESGSGFLIKCDGNRYFIVTCRHVVQPDAIRGIGRPGKLAEKATIEVVFGSGQPNEHVLKAEIVATDISANLALLKVLDAKEYPEPLEHAHALKFVETLPVCILGFPFAADLAKSGRNPAITISRGAVSSIRDDGLGGKTIQVDVEINPGQSGGPIVDTQGRVIGVAVIGIDSTKIGFAVPVEQIARLFEPRLPQMTLAAGQWVDGHAPIKCTIDAVDSLGRIQRVSVRYAEAEGRRPLVKTEADAIWPEIPNAQNADLDFTGSKAVGSFQIAQSKSTSGKYVVQIVVTYTDKSIARSNALQATLKTAGTETIVAGNRQLWDIGRELSLVERGAEVRRFKSPVLAGELKIDVPPTDPQKREPRDCPWCWSNDGKSLYVLSATGVIRKLSCPGLKEEATYQCDLKGGLNIMSTAAGLVVSGHSESGSRRSQTSIIVADANTLQPIRTITDAKLKIERTVASPNSSFAYATTSSGPTALFVIDLAKGEIVKKYQGDDFGFPEPSLKSMVISPDGKWSITRDSTRLFRFRMDGANVKFEEASPKVLQAAMLEEPAISYDGNWVRATCEDRQVGATIDGRYGTSTHLFAMESLSKAPQALHGVAYPRYAGFDRANGHVYVNSEGRMDVFDVKGNYVAGHQLGGILGQQFDRMLVHPDGRYIACCLSKAGSASKRIVLMDLPDVPASRPK